MFEDSWQHDRAKIKKVVHGFLPLQREQRAIVRLPQRLRSEVFAKVSIEPFTANLSTLRGRL